MTTITPFLWFDNNLAEALDFYQSVFPDAVVHGTNGDADGNVWSAEFELNGQQFKGLNGGPMFSFTEAISMFLECDGQDEVDQYWAALIGTGGSESQCGWLKDPYGLSWQVIPRQFNELMTTGTPEQVQRTMTVMYTMSKLDLAALTAAWNGDAAS